MKFATLKKLLFEKNILSFLRLGPATGMLYRSAFATAAGSSGLLDLLAERPRQAGEIAQAMKLGADKLAALEAWLECGVKAGELALRNGRYRLVGKLSRLLAVPANRVSASLFEEVTRYHYEAILQAPQRLRAGRRYTLADQDGELIARSSRILEPFVEEAIDWAFDSAAVPPRSVLEVGCGAGHYLGYMLDRRPGLRITAIDLQPNVVEAARRHLHERGLDGRVQLAQADVMQFDSRGERYDLITLHNSIYYFAAAQRGPLLRRLHELLAPGGRLLLTTSCRGGSPAVAALHLWWALSDVAGGLPHCDELIDAMRGSGFAGVAQRRLLPGESYFGFLATRA